LLLEKQLDASASEEVRNVVRVRTTTVLCQLDGWRVGYVFAFLRETGLMSNTPNSSIVSLGGADFRNVNWSQATLSGATLSGADLSGAKVTEEQLKEAKSLEGAILPDGAKHP
jgi:uncharacterized protein YjbI with pentapeptide repeats